MRLKPKLIFQKVISAGLYSDAYQQISIHGSLRIGIQDLVVFDGEFRAKGETWGIDQVNPYGAFLHAAKHQYYIIVQLAQVNSSH